MNPHPERWNSSPPSREADSAEVMHPALRVRQDVQPFEPLSNDVDGALFTLDVAVHDQRRRRFNLPAILLNQARLRD